MEPVTFGFLVIVATVVMIYLPIVIIDKHRECKDIKDCLEKENAFGQPNNQTNNQTTKQPNNLKG